MLFATEAARAIADAVSSVEVGVRVPHPWFRTIVGSPGRRPRLRAVYAKDLEAAEAVGWTPTWTVPLRLPPSQDAISAFAEVACRRIGLNPSSVRVARVPAFYGEVPRKTCEFVGVYVADGPSSGWARGRQLLSLLRRAGVPAEEAPTFDVCSDAVRWLSRCIAFVGPGVGLAHLAAAVGVPTVLVLGGRFSPRNFPWPSTTAVTSRSCPLGPCGVWDSTESTTPFPFCPSSKGGRGRCGIPCVDAVGVEPVFSAIREVLAYA